MSSFEEQFLANLALIQAALGGSNVQLAEPRSFQSDALLMLAAIALTANGAGMTAEWSGITGDLVDQDELNTALAGKQNHPVNYLTDIINRPDLSVFDNVDTYANLAAFPATGVSDKVYIAADTNTPYRWTGSAYVSIATVNDTLATIGLLNSGQGFLYRALPLGTWELAAIALNTLTDTDVGAPQAGEILEYDGSNWVNAVPSSSGPIEQTTPPNSPSHGDRWLQTDGSGYPVEEWFWNSISNRWLSARVYRHDVSLLPDQPGTQLLMKTYSNGTSEYAGAFISTDPELFFTGCSVSFKFSGSTSSSNYWTLAFKAGRSGEEVDIVPPANLNSQTVGVYQFDRPGYGLRSVPCWEHVLMSLAPTGIPSGLYFTGFQVQYRRVYQ